MQKWLAAAVMGLAVWGLAAADKLPVCGSPAWNALPGMQEVGVNARKGDPDAMYLMSIMIIESKARAGLPLDTIDMIWDFKFRVLPAEKRTAGANWQSYADKGVYLAQRLLAEQLFAKGDPGYIRWYQKAADQGDDVSQYNLALAYLEGRGCEADAAKALKYLELSAAQGNSGAFFNLGVFWKDGTGGKKDIQKAIKYFELAAKKKYTPAAYLLGKIYSGGYGVPADMTLAAKYFRAAAEKESAVALQIQRDGEMFFQNAFDYLDQGNIAKGREYLKYAVDCGHRYAPVMLLRNKFMTADEKGRNEVIKELTVMAEQGNIQAQAVLAMALLTLNRPDEAAVWYCRALGNGEMTAYNTFPEFIYYKFTAEQKKYLEGVFLRAGYLDETEMQYAAIVLGRTVFPEKKDFGGRCYDVLIQKNYPKVLYPYFSLLLSNPPKGITEKDKANIVLELQKLEDILTQLVAAGDHDAKIILDRFSPENKTAK